MDRLAEHYDLCGAALRESDRDRWLACLFAPDEARPHLFALYAFNAEVAAVRDHVSQPLLGEMRLQYWLDLLEGEGDAPSHPTAQALRATIAARNLPTELLRDLLAARRFDLYDEPAQDEKFLETYCDATSSNLFRLASLILGGAGEGKSAEAATYGGRAYALAGLLRALPWHARRRQCYLPLDLLARHGLTPRDFDAGAKSPAILAALAETRALVRQNLTKAGEAFAVLPKAERLAFRPLALVSLDLGAMDRPDYDPFQPAEIPQWRRQWALWRCKI